MIDLQINEAIALAMGYKQQSSKSFWYDCPNGEYQLHYDDLPDYCNDRSAIIEAVKSLPYDLQAYYMRNLFHVLIKVKGPDGVTTFDTHTADPRHCAEAYLKTLDLWKQ